MICNGFSKVSKRLFSTGAKIVPRLTQHLIDGKFVDSISGDTFTTENPANEQVITEISRAGTDDVDRAVQAACKAFDHGPWRKFSGTERGNCLHKLSDLFSKHAEEIAMLETLETGKPISFVKNGEIPFVNMILRYNAGWADKIHGDTIPMVGDYFAYTRQEPVGVAALIVPWNVPLLILANKLAPALASGCTVVVKPAEQTSLSTLRLGELVKEAGIPDGVVNILAGYGEDAGKHLSQHSGVDKVSFTGSTEVGFEIMKNSAAHNHLRRVTLELGGKSPNIICDDADIDMAVGQANFSSFLLEGQACLAGSRTFVHEKIYDEFVEKSAKYLENTKYGDSFDETTTRGPLISKVQQDRVMNYINIGQQQGASLMAGGDIPDMKGYYVKPTIFADVKNDMTIAREEIFGPVMSILKFSDLDEVIEMANDTEFGLAAGVVTKDINKAIHLSNSIRAGTVYINTYHMINPSTPFGGFKNSGLGRDYGKPGIDAYLETKTVVMARPPGSLP